MHRSDANVDADADEEGEAREGGDLGKYKDFIRRGWDDTVDAAGGRCGRGAEGLGRGAYIERPPRWLSPQPFLISH